MAGITTLCDAVAADLTRSVALPPKVRLWKYLDPPVMRADQGSTLAVFARGTDYEVQATDASYEQSDELVVAYFTPSPRDVSQDRDQKVAADALAIGEAIELRLREYAYGVPGLTDQTELDLGNVRRGQITGELYLVEIVTKVRRWS